MQVFHYQYVGKRLNRAEEPASTRWVVFPRSKWGKTHYRHSGSHSCRENLFALFLWTWKIWKAAGQRHRTIVGTEEGIRTPSTSPKKTPRTCPDAPPAPEWSVPPSNRVPSFHRTTPIRMEHKLPL